MRERLNASALLDREYLQIRCRILDIAASLDRIDRADGSESLRSEPRLELVSQAIAKLTDGKVDRAERIQQVFSDPYDRKWQANRKTTP